MQEGFLYVAYGEKYVDECIQSLHSLKRQSPKAHTTLVTNSRIESNLFDNVIYLESDQSLDTWKSALFFKIEGIKASPYRKTFFIDSDTYFIEDCSELFNLMDYFDMLIAHAPADTAVVQLNEIDLVGYYPYNTGVIIFNKTDKIDQFLDDWFKAYKTNFEKYFQDQPAFMEALLKNDLKMYVLHNIYNLRLPAISSILPRKVKILHGRVDDIEAIVTKINKNHNDQRAWLPHKNKLITKASLDPIITKIKRQIPFGVKQWIKKIINNN